MRKTFLAKPERNQLLFLFIALAAISWFFYNNTIDLFPAFIHSWTQSDRYALALGFLDNGFDFFHPKTFNLGTVGGITRVDFPINEYIVAILMKITGSTSPIIFRLYTLAYSFAGLFFLYLLSKKITGSVLKSLLVVFLAFTAPVYVYYQAGFIPSVMAVANVFIGYYFFFDYKKCDCKRGIFYAVFFFTLAALTRFPFVVFLEAVFVQQVYEAFKARQFKVHEGLAFLSGFLAFLAYNAYNVHLGKVYGNSFLSTILPARNWPELKAILKEVFHHWLFEYFSTWQYFAIVAAVILAAVFAFRKNSGFAAYQKYWLQLLIAGVGACVYFLFMSRQFFAHDYYFLDSFFVPVILLFLFSLAILPLPKSIYQAPFKVFLILLVLSFVVKAKEVQLQRLVTGPWDRTEITRQNFIGTAAYLDSIGIPKDAKILVIDAYTTNVPLILMNRKGYTVIGTSRENILYGLYLHNWDYVAISDLYLVSDVIMNYPAITGLIEKVGETGKVSFYKRKEQVMNQDVKSFLGIGPSNTLFDTILTFNTAFVSSVNQVGMLDSETEWGASLSIKAPAIASKVFVWFKVLCEEQLGDVFLVTTIENKGEALAYQNFNLMDYITTGESWQVQQFQFVLPASNSEVGELKVYFYNPSRSSLLYDNVEVVVYRQSAGK